MNLKETFRYQNYLEQLMNNVCMHMSDNVMKITRTHKRKEANPEGEDTTEIEESRSDLDASTDELIAMAQMLIDHRRCVAVAIRAAKAKAGDMLDILTEENKFRRQAATYIGTLLRNTPKTMTETGIGYKFNAEGNQVSYKYNIETTYEDNFDRNETKAIRRQLTEEADKTSTKIDRILITTTVDFEPLFNVNDSYEDAIELFRTTLRERNTES